MSEPRQTAEKAKRTSRSATAKAKAEPTAAAKRTDEATVDAQRGAEPGKTVRAPRRRAAARAASDGVTAVTLEERHRMIAQCAYYRAQSRGWATGGELEDWLYAERQVDALLAGHRAD